MLWTCIIALVAILPWYQYGLGQVSVSGFYMHNAVGMWFTPLALGIFYYALPKLLSRPIYSYALGVFAFWTNLVFYPIIGAHHFLFSPLPWWLQTTAIVFSVAMLVPVWGGSANFLLTMRGRDARDGAFLSADVHLRRRGRLSRRLHPGHVRGVSLAAGGMASHQLHGRTFAFDHVRFRHVRDLGRHLRAVAAGYRQGSRATLGLALHFWMALVGSFIYVISLSIGGTVQGLDWIHGLPFIQSVMDMQAYWVWRGVGGSLMLLSHIVFAWNVWRMTYGAAAQRFAG